ncbi:MAG: UDP-2,3-diacylglucosamine diphosphatase LpxI [Elusimicrobiota bacterium]
MNNELFGLIAGNGDFPLVFLKEAHRQNIPCVVIALKGEADPSIESLSSSVFWVNIGHLNELIGILKTGNVTKAVMCGQVVHTRLFTEVKLDWRAIKLLGYIKDRKTDSILRAVADELSSEGIELISSITLLDKYVPNQKGPLTKTKPSKSILQDIEFGMDIAKKLAGLDIGQTVVVKERVVVAVESLEGTDKCIQRAYELAGAGIVVVKVNKPNQDLRFDVPVIGERTFTTLKSVKAGAIAFESGKTLFLDSVRSLEIADESKIVVYGI